MAFNVYRQLDLLPASPRGIALGVFDGVHCGHRHLISMMLSRSDEQGLRPGVFSFSYETGVGFNERKVNHDFLMTDDEKIETLRSLGVKDIFLVPLTSEFCHLSAQSFLDDVLVGQLDTRLLAIGEDGRFGWKGMGDASFLQEYACHHALEPLIVPDFMWKGAKVTSTRIREALANGRIEDATEMMGRAFHLKGAVVKGSHLGSRIGFPTANFLYPSTASLLRRGVYATHTSLDGKRYPSISNVGVAPSVRKIGSELLVETHIFDYTGNLYGRTIDVEFEAFVRDECVFMSIDELASRVGADLDAVRAWHRAGGHTPLYDRPCVVK